MLLFNPDFRAPDLAGYPTSYRPWGTFPAALSLTLSAGELVERIWSMWGA
jgi:hypothetical protein